MDETVSRMKKLLQTAGINLVAIVDHSGAAADVGLTMNSTKLLIFGNPRAGTPAMNAAPELALDLPLKALIWQDSQVLVWLSYNDPAYIQNRYGISDDLFAPLKGVGRICERAASDSVI
jgi:uncharacterized protein (DUF302 family)